MKKFSRLMLHLIELERTLAKELIEQISNEDPKSILTNAAHDKVYEILEFGKNLLLEDKIEKKNQKPKLRLIQGG